VTRRARGAARRPRARWDDAVIADAEKLLARPNVERVQLGWKERAGRVTQTLAVKVYVTEKADTLDPGEQVPKSTRILVPIGRGLYRSRRVATDVVWTRPATFVVTPGDFLNPVPGGAMIGVSHDFAGTLTCAVRDGAGRLFALTAGHVVQPFQGPIDAGIPVLQPSDPGAPVPGGGSPLLGETFAGYFGNTKDGFLDFALVRVGGPRKPVSTPFDGLPVVKQLLAPSAVMSGPTPVTKFGAFTGRTHGVFSARVESMTIEGVQVTRVMEFKGISGPVFGSYGDSGSLVVSEAQGSAGMIVGVLIAVAKPAPDAPHGRGYVVPFQRLPGLMPA
jgi:hypothetical protein